MSIYDHARTILLHHQKIILGAMASDPVALSGTSRSATSEGDLWTRYCCAVITPMQRITARFWERLDHDRAWQRLLVGESRRRPSRKALVGLFERHGVRFPAKKAERILGAWDRDFYELTCRINGGMKHAHGRGLPLPALRSIEVELCRLIQYEMRDCGVGPKVSRLMMSWPTSSGPLFSQVVPIDSRWQKRLRASGVELDGFNLACEDSYRLLENEICQAAWSLYLPPRLADGAVFGWLGARDEEEGED